MITGANGLTNAGPAAQARRAFRNTLEYYISADVGKVAIDGSLINRVMRDDHAISTAWLGTPECPWCIPEQFRRFFSYADLVCRVHGRLREPPTDPFPMSAREWEFAESREWSRFAAELGIRPRYQSVRMETARPTPAILAMRDFLDDPEHGFKAITLAGPTGVGKTFALIAGLREDLVHDPHSTAVLWTMPALVRALITEDSEAIVEKAIGAQVLALDDVGATYVKEDGMAEALIEEIFCEREARELQTMLSTNLTEPRFADALGDRIADRLHGSWGRWCSLPGESLRRPRQLHATEKV